MKKPKQLRLTLDNGQIGVVENPRNPSSRYGNLLEEGISSKKGLNDLWHV
jgi:hypothetical protein